MKLIIAGSRSITERDFVYLEIEKYKPFITVIISGGATGVDSLAEEYALANNIPFQLFPADWKRYGKSAGPIRNKEMAKAGTHLLAFWDGESRGTKHMIDFCRSIKRPVVIVEKNVEKIY